MTAGDELRETTPDARAGGLPPRIRRWLFAGSILGLTIVAVIVLAVAYTFGLRLSSIRVTYTGAQEEVRDVGLPFVDKRERLPDYRLEVIAETKGFWIFNRMKYQCGPVPNRSAQETIEFAFAGDVPRDKIQQINLFEADPVKDDLVASIQVLQDTQEAEGYRFELQTDRSLRFGFDRIWQGNFGLAVIATMIALVLTLLFAAFEFLISLPFAVLAGLWSRRSE